MDITELECDGDEKLVHNNTSTKRDNDSPSSPPDLELADLSVQNLDSELEGQHFATPKLPSGDFSSCGSSLDVKTPTIIITPTSTPNKSNNEFVVTPLKGNPYVILYVVFMLQWYIPKADMV